MSINLWGDKSANLDFLFINSPLSDYSKPHPDYVVFWPPMGEAYLASYLHNKGFRGAVWDADVDKIPPEKVARVIAEINPRWVGFNTFTPGREVLQNILSRRESIFPDVKPMLGGIDATVCTQELAELPEIQDVVIVRNDGEKKAEALLRGVPPEQIPGIGIRHEGGAAIVNEENLAWFVDINSPECKLDRRYVPYDPTIKGQLPSPDGKRRAFQATSRGCAWECTYCASAKKVREGGKLAVRFRKADSVVEEMLEIIRCGVNDIKQNDDLGLCSSGRIKSLFQPILKEGYGRDTGLEIRGNGRANIIAKLDNSTLDLMRNVGVRRVGMGVEQATIFGMEAVKKDITPWQVIYACERLASRGISYTTNYMFGFPHQDNRESRAIVALGLRTVLIGRKYDIDADVDGYQLRPYPGTEVYEGLLRSGISREEISASNHININTGLPGYMQVIPAHNFSQTDPEVERKCLDTLRSLPKMSTSELQQLEKEYPSRLFLETEYYPRGPERY